MTPFKITEAAIRSRVGQRSFQRGWGYFQQNAIVSPRREGNTLRARCWGTAPRAYRLWVQFEDDVIVAADCSCPVGDGGYCKHTAALLLTWLHAPHRFQEGASLADALEQRDKADLLLLIRQMLARYPDLEELIDLYPAGSADADAPVDPGLIRRQVEHAFQNADYGYDEYDAYGATAGIADEVESIMQRAAPYRERGAWLDAATLYQTVLESVRAAHAETYDEEGHLSRVLWEGSVRLGECLPQIDDPEVRRTILRTLTDIIIDDISLGGYGFADSAYDIVLEHATETEKSEIVARVEAEVASYEPGPYDSGWRKEAFGGFLLDLQADSLSDEAFIEICRQTGRYHDLVSRLLQLDRLDEAVSSTNSASDYALLSLANLFVEHGHDRVAEELIWERAGKSNDTRLDAWLKDRAIATGDWRQAFTNAEAMFRRQPRIEQYRELKEIGAHLDDWDEKREEILSTLMENASFELLTEIHLDEGNVEAALETLPRVRFGRMLAMDVAEAAEETHPREAIRLYREEIDRLIAGRGRDNYAEASAYLLRVRYLYGQLGEADRWQEYLTAIRNQKPRLPALLDEMRQAGL